MNLKRWIRAGFVGVALIVIFLLLLSPLVKWYVEDHSEEWTGRKITMEKLRLNPFRGSLTIEGLKMFERNSEAIFFKIDEFYVNVELLKAIAGQYEITELNVSKPEVVIIQTSGAFNFDDLIERFASDSTTSQQDADTSKLKYWLRNLTIQNGIAAYKDTRLANEVKLIQLNVDCPLIAWDDPSQRFTADFKLANGGNARFDVGLNTDSRNYLVTYEIDDLNVDLLYPYMKDYLNTGSLTGYINTALQLRGSMDVPEEIALRGKISLKDMSVTDPQKENLVTIGLVQVDVDSIDVKSNLYNFKRINIEKPYLKFELFDEGNNFSQLVNYSSSDSLASDTTSVNIDEGNIFELLASYIRDLSEKYVVSNYKADSITVSEGTLLFNDYTLDNKFNYNLEHLAVNAERISSANQKLEFNISSVLNTSGNMNGKITVNPDGFRDMVIDYTIADLKISDFNPYSSYYVAHPFLDGTCYYNTRSSIEDLFLKSQNKVEIRRIIVGHKEKKATVVDLPIRLAVALLRDVDGNIILDIPIEGNLNDPKYRLGPIIWQILKNLVLKAVAAPGKLLAKKSGVDPKYLEGIEWQLLQTELDEEQKKGLDAVAKTLMTTPEMNVEFLRVYNVPREGDQLALQEGKKSFLFFKRRISSDDVIPPEEQKLVEALPAKDSAFNAYVDDRLQTKNSMLSIFDKSKTLVGSHKLERKLQEILQTREDAIIKYLTESAGLPVTRFRIVDVKEQKAVPYASFSRLNLNFFLADEQAGIPNEATAKK